MRGFYLLRLFPKDLGEKKEKEKRACARSGEEEDAFPSNESFASSEEGELRSISTDMKIKSQKQLEEPGSLLSPKGTPANGVGAH